MAIPPFQDLMLPLLEMLGEEERSTSDIVRALEGRLHLSEDDRSAMMTDGRRSVFANRVHWALVHLGKRNLIEKVRKGVYRASQSGQELRRSSTATQQAALAPVSLRTGQAGVEQPATPEPSATPDEQLSSAIEAIQEAVHKDLLEQILGTNSPAFFEKLVVDLLTSMMATGSQSAAGQTLGRSGDGGIDGVVRLDPLGLDEVHIQAKLYRETAIPAEQVRAFAAAVADAGSRKGVFITTSRFTADARRFAERQQGVRIILVDGTRLVQLMADFGIGVHHQTIRVARSIDSDYFTLDAA